MEVWKEYFVEELSISVLVSDLGTVKTFDKTIIVENQFSTYEKFVPGCIKTPVCNGKAGYYQITLYNNGNSKKFYVHRLVWLSHMGEIPVGYEIDHDDNDKSNNKLTNLNLKTRKQNMVKCHTDNPHIMLNLKNQN